MAGGGRGSSADFTEVRYQPAGIYGWRKRCLYIWILFILIVVVMNLALTIWILRVFNFSINKDLQIMSSRDVKLQGISDSEMKQTSLHIGKDGIIATCGSFEVQDKAGKTKLFVSDTEVQYHADEVVYTGKAVFDGSVETPLLRGPITESLRLESASSSIMLSGPEGISVQAPAGDILIKSSDDIIIHADNNIFFNSTNLFLKNVPVSNRRRNGHTYPGVYQLCMCENGHGSPVSTLIVLFLINFHMFRRLIECLFVSVFSESQMSIIIYIVGLLFYTIMPLSYVVGTDFTSIDGCTGFLGKIKWNHIVGLLLFLWSSWKQMKAAQIFANLRLTKKGAVDRQHHIPVGDIFQYVSCPHFFFEILIYTSVNVIYWWSCTLAIFVLLFVAANQITMGHFSHKWYKDTFRFYPDNRKAIIPFVY